MLKRKTVFVIGAGASCEVGLPSGQQLRERIARALNMYFQHGSEQTAGSRAIYEAFRVLARNEGNDINLYVRAGWMIRDAAPLSLSIDNFIDAHRGDVAVEKCGKLAIAETILEAERASTLFVDKLNGAPSISAECPELGILDCFSFSAKASKKQTPKRLLKIWSWSCSTMTGA
ncbi:MAG: hypothetical protein JO208_06415 [Alphaproteobacteria bacterium]|nr:hypothetical protein [Alphaproteobacteria bacterium]